MKYSYKLDKARKIITVTVVGELYPNDFSKIDIDVCTLALSHDCKIVFNFTEVIIHISIGEAYFWFSNHLDKVNFMFRSIPTALVANDENEKFLHFVETTWSNRGMKIKMFKELDEALLWLK
jgi:hypothetical protein